MRLAKFFRLLSLVLLAATAIQARAQITVDLTAGWNLLGNSSSTALDVSTGFGDQAKVITVWKWMLAKSGWAFYTPSLSVQALNDYAAGKGYDVLTTINGGEGFWVNAKTAFTVQLPAGTAVQSASFRNLAAGWNLIAIGDNSTPSQFNVLISSTTPAAGVVPVNLTTLWAWDAAQANWYFYAPSLAISGALASYIASKSYLDFGAMTLGPTMGFWTNIPAGSPGSGTSSAPANLTAMAGEGRITFAWQPVAGATSYNLYYATTTGVTKASGTKLAGATSPYVGTGLTNGADYFAVVTAVNASGESADSDQVSATPMAGAASLLGTWTYAINADGTSTANYPGDRLTGTLTFSAAETFTEEISVYLAGLTGTCRYAGGTYAVSGNTVSIVSTPTSATTSGVMPASSCNTTGSFKSAVGTLSPTGSTLTMTDSTTSIILIKQ